MTHFFTLNTIIELICLLFAVSCLAKDTNRAWRSQIWFLLITCVIELTGIYVKKFYYTDTKHVHSNAWIYNIYLLCQASFISAMFYSLLNKYVNSKLIISVGFAIIAVFYGCEILNHGFLIYNSLTNTVMSVLFVLYSLYYYYFLLKDDVYINLKYLPAFWWIAGTLFFYFGKTACNMFYTTLSPKAENFKQQLVYITYIYYGLNILLYGCWSYSFVCRKWLITTFKN